MTDNNTSNNNTSSQTSGSDDQTGVPASDLGDNLTQTLSMDTTIQRMKDLGLPITRDGIIGFHGEDGDWGAEQEASLPEHLQNWEDFRNGPYGRDE